jgi:hypothetical protein
MAKRFWPRMEQLATPVQQRRKPRRIAAQSAAPTMMAMVGDCLPRLSHSPIRADGPRRR